MSNTRKTKVKYRNLKRSKQGRMIVSALKEKYGPRCWYCGIKINERLSVDHIHPRSKGGSDDIDNFALTCPRCNYAKFDDNIIDFLEWLSYIRSSGFECLILGKLPKEEINKINPKDWDRLRKDFWE